jgi:hypothetical protein
MKKIYGVLLLGSLVFAACRKTDNIPADSGCISKIHRVDYHVSAADSLAAVALLKQNNIPYDNVDFEYVSSYSVGDTAHYTSVFFIQEINGLPIISGDFWYQFKNNVLQTVNGKKYSGVPLDTHSKLTLPQLRQLFLKAVAQYKYGPNVVSETPVSINDSCVVAEFGYYDLNTYTKDAPANFVKAWSVSPTPGSFPQALFRDDNGALIVYHGPIVFASN